MSETNDEGLGPSRCYAVGDELAFRCGSHTHYWVIAKIEKITPSGRIKVGRWELNPDLTVRGRSGWHGPYEGQPVTGEILQEIERAKNLRIVKDAKFDKLTDEQLAEVVRIVQSA
jgi:hypothetical protein